MSVYEPYDTDHAIPGAITCTSLAEAAKDADIILLLVPHTQLTAIKPEQINNLAQNAIIFDTVNGWDRAEWKQAGFSYSRLGDGKNR